MLILAESLLTSKILKHIKIHFIGFGCLYPPEKIGVFRGWSAKKVILVQLARRLDGTDTTVRRGREKHVPCSCDLVHLNLQLEVVAS